MTGQRQREAFAIVPFSSVHDRLLDKPRALQLYVELKKRAGSRGWASPTPAELRARFGYSIATLERTIAVLVKRRCIRTERERRSDGTHGPRTFFVNSPNPDDKERTEEPKPEPDNHISRATRGKPHVTGDKHHIALVSSKDHVHVLPVVEDLFSTCRRGAPVRTTEQNKREERDDAEVRAGPRLVASSAWRPPDYATHQQLVKLAHCVLDDLMTRAIVAAVTKTHPRDDDQIELLQEACRKYRFTWRYSRELASALDSAIWQRRPRPKILFTADERFAAQRVIDYHRGCPHETRCDTSEACLLALIRRMRLRHKRSA